MSLIMQSLYASLAALISITNIFYVMGAFIMSTLNKVAIYVNIVIFNVLPSLFLRLFSNMIAVGQAAVSI